MFTIRKCGSLRCGVCRSLLTDSDWSRVSHGVLMRGSIRVCPETGHIQQNGFTVPLWAWERYCVRRAVRRRAEMVFAINQFKPSDRV